MLPITVLDESVLPSGALTFLNILVAIYVLIVTPLLIILAYLRNTKKQAETDPADKPLSDAVMPEDPAAPEQLPEIIEAHEEAPQLSDEKAAGTKKNRSKGRSRKKRR